MWHTLQNIGKPWLICWLSPFIVDEWFKDSLSSAGSLEFISRPKVIGQELFKSCFMVCAKGLCFCLGGILQFRGPQLLPPNRNSIVWVGWSAISFRQTDLAQWATDQSKDPKRPEKNTTFLQIPICWHSPLGFIYIYITLPWFCYNFCTVQW